MLLTAFALAVSLLFSQPSAHQEYMMVTEIEAVDSATDLITVCDADGNESAFYADACTYMAPGFAKVTVNAKGEIIFAENAM